jgi:hypothetical protein
MSEKLITAWATDCGSDQTEPVEQFCKEFGYPHKTECGATMYANTHFLIEADAWQKLLDNRAHWVKTNGRFVASAREHLREAAAAAALAAEHYAVASEKFEAFKARARKANS